MKKLIFLACAVLFIAGILFSSCGRMDNNNTTMADRENTSGNNANTTKEQGAIGDALTDASEGLSELGSDIRDGLEDLSENVSEGITDAGDMASDALDDR